ncbi:hypothetical protein [Enterococcus casseliflavus]|uniref:hypothetical protein n=1 Tax=Enterococcus casseliflavus TaxID=37734 RepID=UPI0001B6D6A5|nr:hypothetical protein [Enterococcus casseliflavus]EEV28416.1 predicted protein [Enterococcus casseliflavus EC30]EEV34751.1 predicted protein [Enterococcus casseliflavus EC10]
MFHLLAKHRLSLMNCSWFSGFFARFEGRHLSLLSCYIGSSAKQKFLEPAFIGSLVKQRLS